MSELQKEITIDNKRFLISKYKMADGLAKKAHLVKVIAGILSKTGKIDVEIFGKMLAETNGENPLDKNIGDINFSAIGDSLLGLFDVLPPEELPKFLKRFLDTTYFISGIGEKVAMNDDRADSLINFSSDLDYFRLVFEAIVFNLGERFIKENADRFFQSAKSAKELDANKMNSPASTVNEKQAPQPRIKAR